MKKEQNYLKEHNAFMKKRFKEIKDWKGIFLMFAIVVGIFGYIAFASAVSPFTNPVGSKALIIEHPIADPIKAGDWHKFHFHVTNYSDGKRVNISLVTCSFHLYNSSGSHIFKNNYGVSTDDVFDFEQVILGGNFTTPGQYAFVFQCNSSAEGGFYTHDFIVTPTGDDRNYGFFLVLILAALVLFIGGYIIDQDWLIFLSGILWLTVGVYTMIYGVGDLTDLYTRSIAGVTLAIGLVLIVAAIFNISKGGSNSDDSFSEE